MNFKFRAWFPKQQKMVSDEWLIFEYEGGADAIVASDQLTEEATFAAELMQYTGVNDMNGTEIYEGDIVNLHGPKVEKRLIRFEHGAFHYGWVHDVMGDHTSMEVIGNQYENPELLEEVTR